MRNPALAATRFTQACDGGIATACFELAALYHTGQGVTKDAARVRELLDKACKGGEQRACAAAKR